MHNYAILSMMSLMLMRIKSPCASRAHAHQEVKRVPCDPPRVRDEASLVQLLSQFHDTLTCRAGGGWMMVGWQLGGSWAAVGWRLSGRSLGWITRIREVEGQLMVSGG